jgi:TonB family protein
MRAATVLSSLLAVSAAGADESAEKTAAQPKSKLELRREVLELVPRRNDTPLPPVWRDVERDVGAAFKPAPETVSDRPAAALLINQLRGYFGAARAHEQGHDDPALALSRERQAELLRRFEEEPSEWTNTEIEVRVDANGEIQATRVVQSSGRADLDREAVQAVRAAAARRSRQLAETAEATGHQQTLVRFSVEAGVVVPPPTLRPAQADPRGQGITVGMGFRFEETTGHVTPHLPLVRRVVTRVRLLDVRLQR